ncbi:MAG: prepilin-type N-terminal cleavage/methylation domain-containing protein [Eubacteriales bacterium]
MKNAKGMTLVELSVALVIMMIIGGVIIQFLLSATQMFKEKQLSNEQVIIMDHIMAIMEEEVRYMEYIYLSNGAASGDITNYAYYTLTCVDNQLICDGVVLTSASIMDTHTMTVEFESTAAAVLKVTVYLDTAESYSRKESFNIRLLNMELYNNTIDEASGDAISQIYYSEGE